jgi:hypothetical protein
LSDAQFKALDTNGDQMLSREELQAIVDDVCTGCFCAEAKSLSQYLGDAFLFAVGTLVLAAWRRGSNGGRADR